MTKKIAIIFLMIVALAGGLGFYFREGLFGLYNKAAENLQNFQKKDLGDVISELKKEIFTPEPLNVGGKDTQAFLLKSRVIAETNVQRYENGMLPPLLENAELNAAAQAKAKDMFLNQYFEHTSPSGVDLAKLAKFHGYEYVVVGENLILGNFKDEQEMVQAWMNSPGHRANILQDRFTEIGVAVVKGIYKGESVWIGVQEFGLPLSACPNADSKLKNQIDTNRTALDQLAVTISAKKREIESANPRSSQYDQLVDEHNQLVAQYNSLADATKDLISQYNTQVTNFNKCIAGS